MNVAVASPLASAYSETFIAMQMERLPAAFRIHGGPVASETVPGGRIAPLRSVRGLIDTLIEIGIFRTRWDGPQRRELKRRLIRSGVDVVLANYGPVGVALLPLCRDLGLPLVTHFHGYDAHATEVVLTQKDSYARLGRHARSVIAVSRRMADALATYGVPQNNIHVVRYGCDAELFCQKTEFSGPPAFLAVGRFVDKKAPYLTLLAFKKVHDALPDARLTMIGDGALIEVTRNIAATLGLRDAVEFAGVLDAPGVAACMKSATAFVQHSLVPKYGPTAGDSEGTPVAILEAMVVGLPVVATHHAGIAEVIDDGRTGLLVQERDVDGMAEAMFRVATDTSLAQSLGSAARQEALAKYTAGHYISALRQLLQ